MANTLLKRRDALSYRAARLAAWLGARWTRYVLVAVPVGGMPAMPRGFVWGELARCDPALCDGVAAAWRRAQGMACLGVWREGGPVVGVTWVKTGAFDEDEAPLVFAPPAGWAWDTGLYVRPEARGGRAFAALWGATRGWLEARGLDGTMSRIADYNEGSRRAHLRMDGREVGRVGVLAVTGRARVWGGAPALLRAGERARVAL